MIKALFLVAILAATAAPAMAQPIFDSVGEEPPSPAADELQQWKRATMAQIIDHSPASTGLGRGRAIVNFCVDAAGRVVKENLGEYSGNAQALIAASIISSLELPPAPRTVKAKLRGNCYWFQACFTFH